MTLPTALIAEYLALATTLETDAPAGDYRRANQLSYQLAMELPIDLWRAILAALGSGNGQAVWDAISTARLFNGLGRELTINDAVVHAPGAGRQPGHFGANVTSFPGVARTHGPVPESQPPQSDPPPEPSQP